ncbi:MAG TPA: aminoglycoside phosphotransferase [Pseudonocardia sp.]|nr:aminoglycoside phosphotransferase [Pseudonocardia sp.]
MSFVEELVPHLPEWLGRQRWFGAKGREVGAVDVVSATSLTDTEPFLDLLVLAVSFADGGPAQHYQLLLGRRQEARGELEHVTIGRVGGLCAYDALWDHTATAWLLEAVRAGRTIGAVRFVPEEGATLAPPGFGRVMGAEQSNTSVVFGERTIMKLFRRLNPGVNPDLELHRALRSVGSTEVAALQGAVEGTLGGQPTTLAMLQDFAANSADGWAMALASVRDLFAEADLRADEVGGDFAGEASRIGETVAIVHAELARALGTAERDPAELAAAWSARLDAAARDAPVLAPYVDAVRAVYDAVAGLPDPILAHRVHGDLHLGQLLRTTHGWLILDFEGEPSAPLAERRRPDSPMRDVAGMLRSFDYAAFFQLLSSDPRAFADGRTASSPLLWHAKEWTARNRDAFCDGYAVRAGVDPRRHGPVLRAFELDKAVYEVVYETRSRPGWVPIPLSSIKRLTAGATSGSSAG